MPDESGVKHYVLATAGHVDHGKTALIKALTGTDTDRLPEEKRRGITIELGFAHLDLPGFSIGVIDVPGHEDFVRNMIAGVGAIDLALLVVAADDGWMPQTEEHLQILAYLGVTRVVVALTKSDLGNADARSAEIRARLQNSPFANAPIVLTSVRASTGIDELRSALAREFSQLPPPRDFGKPRLSVDRVFTIHGSGTVVTGSLSGGSFARGENVVIQPQNLTARIRALQSHNQALDVATPRRRLALNLADVAPEQLSRGSTICGAQNAKVSRVMDVLLTRSSRLPADARPIRDGAVLNLHFGSARIAARVQLLDADQFPQRLEAAAPWTIARLRLAEPVCAFMSDRFILRDASERQTIAGGLVLDATSGAATFRSNKQCTLLDRRALAPDDLSVLLRTRLERDQFAPRLTLLANAPFSEAEIAATLEQLAASGIIYLDEKIAADLRWWKWQCQTALELIGAEHAAHPERPGLEVNRLREALRITNPDLFAALLRALGQNDYRQAGAILRRADFQPSLPPNLQAAGDRIRALTQARPLDPPARKDLARDGAAIQALRFLCQSGELVVVGPDLIMSSEAIAKLRAAIELQLGRRGGATVSELRQATGTTRRVIVPLLEYFDQIGLTKRTGDRRFLRR
jgi:selenocysteine-specific elongation factor